jgi:hypothetical protein
MAARHPDDSRAIELMSQQLLDGALSPLIAQIGSSQSVAVRASLMAAPRECLNPHRWRLYRA